MLGLNQISLAVNRLYGPGAPAAALSLDFTSGSLGTATLTRGSTGTRFNSSGLLESVAVDGARFDFNPVTLAAKGLLVEASRTNLVQQSSAFDNTFWAEALIGTITAGTTVAPDGQSTAETITATAGAGVHAMYSSVRVVGTFSTITHAISIFVKKGTNRYAALTYGASESYITCVFDLDGGTEATETFPGGSSVPGTLLSNSQQSVGNGWYRLCIVGSVVTGGGYLTLAFANTATGNVLSGGNPTFTAAGTETMYIWGAQLEVGAFPTSYIPTTTAAVTRSADVAVVPIPSTVSNIRITYEDNATSDVAVTPSTNYTIPTSQKAVKSIISI